MNGTNFGEQTSRTMPVKGGLAGRRYEQRRNRGELRKGERSEFISTLAQEGVKLLRMVIDKRDQRRYVWFKWR